MVQSKSALRRSGPAPTRRGPCRLECSARAFSADLAGRPNQSDLWRVTVKSDEEEEVNVIDLGAPRKVRTARGLVGRAPRAPHTYTPNPRLYPGPQKPQKRQDQTKQKRKTDGHRKRNKGFYRRPVPNSRLYRPAPPKPTPPPAKPRTVWRPPVPGQLETASRVALRLNGLWLTPDQSRSSGSATPLKPVLRTRKRSPIREKHSPLRSRKLVIKLPAAAGDGNPSEQGLPYRPASRHFRDRDLRSRDSTPTGGRVIQQTTRGNMDAAPRHSTSPEDCSEGNDPQSAPSEFLAEFLSAIMRRQYAEALKYCRLILQYEPRNATARGFYPLLQQKLAQQSLKETSDKPVPPRSRHQRSRAGRSPDLVRDFYPLLQQKLAQQSPRETSDKPTPPRSRHQRSRAGRSPDLGGASSGANSGESSPVPQGLIPHEVVMEQEADSPSCSPRPGSADGSERSEGSPGLGSVTSQSSLELDSSPARSSPSLSLSRRTDSASASGTWDSSGSGARDDNGNPAPAHTSSPKSYACDAENNLPLGTAAAGRSPRRAARAPPLTLQSEQSSESLRRLRAQFTCSIK